MDEGFSVAQRVRDRIEQMKREGETGRPMPGSFDYTPIIFADTYDEAVVGVTRVGTEMSERVVYSWSRLRNILLGEKMDPLIVDDFIRNHFTRVDYGPTTPIIVYEMDEEETKELV